MRKEQNLALLGTLLAAVVLLWLVGTLPTAADTTATVRYVAPGGDCGGATPCYATIQDAVDAAEDDDEIRVAQGTYTGVSTEDGITALVHMEGNFFHPLYLTLRGGYTTGDWEHSDPEAHPTVLDAQGQGVVVYVECFDCDYGHVTLDGFHITGGNASEAVAGVDRGGGISAKDARDVRIKVLNCDIYGNTAGDGTGGGIYYNPSDGTTIRNNRIHDNTGDGIAMSWSDTPEIADNVITNNTGNGVVLYSSLGRVEIRNNTIISNRRGIYVFSTVNSIIENNTILSNTAVGYAESGGGIRAVQSIVTVRNNLIRGNTADSNGGGLYLEGDGVIENNRFEDNHATAWASEGGGVYANSDVVTLRGNSFISNTASGDGGGASVLGPHATDILVQNNLFRGNGADTGGGLDINTGFVEGNLFIGNQAADTGGGLYTWSWEGLWLRRNVFRDNHAGADGGGLDLEIAPPVHLDSNLITGNTAGGNGGGLYSAYGVPSLHGRLFLTNTLVVDNHAPHGSGIYLDGGLIRFKHTTLANNDGADTDDGVGLYIKPGSIISVVLTNTIIASQTTGVYAEGVDVALAATLWGDGAWDNGDDWAGGGNILTGTLNYWGDPLFVDPANGDYHISANSPARDKGIDAGVSDDMDGELRPHPDTGIPDLGADEYHLDDIRIYLPLVVRP